MEPLISVIVPIYNVEVYLRHCVDSICNQTYRNLEIILVNDGSPDRCGEICDAYAARDPRIRVIHKANGGLSDARNAGLASASGSYLMFVDSDDLLPRDAVHSLISMALSENADLVIGKHVRFSDVVPDITASGISAAPQILNSAEAMKDMLESGCAAWARLYRREIHQSIPFPVGEINEDEAIVLRILENCKKILKTDVIVYFYRCRPESITSSDFSTKKLAWQKHCADNLKFIQKNYPELEADAAARYRDSLLWSLTEIAQSTGDYSEEIRALKAALQRHEQLFFTAPFSYPQDRIRMWFLSKLPFGIYRTLLHLKRR